VTRSPIHPDNTSASGDQRVPLDGDFCFTAGHGITSQFYFQGHKIPQRHPTPSRRLWEQFANLTLGIPTLCGDTRVDGGDVTAKAAEDAPDD